MFEVSEKCAQITEGSRIINRMGLFLQDLLPYQMKGKLWLTELLLGTNNGYIATNLNQSKIQSKGNITVHFLVRSKCLRLRHQLCCRILREYC
jgi:hypothetical protein